MKKVKYAVYFILMLLLARAEISDGIRPFDLGLYLGLIYAGENFAVLSPLFASAHFIANPSVNSLILSVTTVALTAGLYFISFKLKKRVSTIEINLVALIARVPVIIMSARDSSLLLSSLITLVIAQIFTYVAIIALYAIIKRGIRNKMTQDEAVSASAMIMALSSALYCLNLWGYQPYYTIAAFVILILIADVGGNFLTAAVLIGLGSAISGDLMPAAAMTLSAVVAMIFRRMPLIFAASAYLLADLAAGYFFSAYGEYGLIHIIAVAAGLAAALIIPPKLHEKIRCETKNIRKGLAARAVINMNRYELSSQIASVGKAFNDISLSLRKDSDTVPGVLERMDALKDEMSRKVCGSCERWEECYKEDGSSMQDLFDGIIKGASDRGRATLIDVPPLLTSVCRRIGGLTQTATDLVKSCESKIEGLKSADKAKLLLAEQSAGISCLMNDLARKSGSSVTAEDNYEERIIEDLAYRNVICSEVLIWNSLSRGITLIVRQSDRDKKVIDKVLYNRTKMYWQRSDIRCEYTNGMCALTFYPAPQYEVLTGECMATKTGSILSGDTRSITRIGFDKVMIALSDGMGSGERAESSSSNAIAMIENLYTAGFASETILTLANNLLSGMSDESFSALDLAILDLDNGYADFVKLGAVSGYIRTEQGVEAIEGGSLPLGIVEEMKPAIKRRKLKTDELCLILSDGVIDTIGKEQIDRILINNSALNPQVVANEIIRCCLSRGIKDDVTVITFRLYRKI